jgi:CheY-like chemotaxis protein
MGVRVLLADDHKLFRQGLASLIKGQTDWEIVAEAGDGEEAVALAAQSGAEVVILDLEMPKLNGLEAARQRQSERPREGRAAPVERGMSNERDRAAPGHQSANRGDLPIASDAQARHQVALRIGEIRPAHGDRGTRGSRWLATPHRVQADPENDDAQPAGQPSQCRDGR